MVDDSSPFKWALIYLVFSLLSCAPSPSKKGVPSGQDQGEKSETAPPIEHLVTDSMRPMDDVSLANQDMGSGMPSNGALSCKDGFATASTRPAPGYPVLSEVSGVVASRQRPDLLWMHNDSGDGPVLYAVGTDGQARGRYQLPTTARDWEDLALAACPEGEGDCLWVGDIGDNGRSRDSVQVIAVREPTEDGDTMAEDIWSYDLRYSGGPMDAEALLVSPDGTRLWIIEKKDGDATRIFSHGARPLSSEGTTVLEPIAEFDAPGLPIDKGRMVTGADLHPAGHHMLLRVYSGIYLYALSAHLDVASLRHVEPITVTLGPLTEPQGEAIGYDHAGLGFWTVSENPEGSGPMPMNYFACLTEQAP